MNHPLDRLLFSARKIEHELKHIALEATNISVRNTRMQTEMVEIHAMILAVRADMAEATPPAPQSKTWPERVFSGTVCRDENCPCHR